MANNSGTEVAPWRRPDSAYRIVMTANRAALKEALTRVPSTADRTLDLLVLNQGHGGVSNFAGWSAPDLQANLVAPMLQSGMKARIIVLDFCLSASLLPTFVPLCTPDGIIVSNLYSISSVVMTSDLWRQIKPRLVARDVTALHRAILQRMGLLTRGVTGLAHLEDVRLWNAAKVTAHLRLYPRDQDPLSAFRYLWEIGQLLQDPSLADAQLDKELRMLKAQIPAQNLGPAEAAILAFVPDDPAMFDRARIAAQLRSRVVEVLSAPRYRIECAPAADLPLFGQDTSLWALFRDFRPNLLALLAGLPRCPTPFTVFDAGTGRLSLDATLLLRPIPPTVDSLLMAIEPSAPQDVADILALLTGLAGREVIPDLDPIVDYLQA